MKKIYYNGRVYAGANEFHQAFAVENGRFVFVGSNEDALKLDAEKTIDLNGGFVCAGFNDSHMHLLNLGRTLQIADCASHSGSLKELFDYLNAFCRDKKLPHEKWLIGRGWNQDFFRDENRFPDRFDLDQLDHKGPICIIRACGHICAVNSAALKLIEQKNGNLEREGGQVDRGTDRKPNGIFRENALELVYSCFDEYTKEDIAKLVIQAQRCLNSYGITSVQTDDFCTLNGIGPHEVIDIYRLLEKEGKLTVRINEQCQFTNADALRRFIEEGYHTGWGSEMVKLGPLKLLADGSLGAHTALMSEPYADNPATSGIGTFTQAQLDEMISLAVKNDMQVAVHAIGDGALDRVLHAYEKFLDPQKDHRCGVVHCQITRNDQLRKFKELNLHAYFQSIFLDYDIRIVEKRIGKQKAKSCYAFKTLFESVHASNGSDAPVEMPDVMAGIQCALTRRTLKEGIGPYLLEEALDIREALDSFTIEGAYASFEENSKGRIREGMHADFVILSRDPFLTDSNRLKDIRVIETVLGGKTVYCAE